jgi:spoIIIJ-associated protein
MLEFDGKDLEEALSAAASAVGRPAAELDYELVEGGRKGVFGLGSKPVRIRVAPSGPSAPRRMLEEVLRLMGYALEVSEARHDGILELSLDGADRAGLLDKDGELLAALETVLGRMGRRVWPTEPPLRLRCPGFSSDEDAALAERIRGIAGEVLRSRARHSLPEMNPYERRIVHMTVREFPGLRSISEGDGFLKRVHVETTGS